MAKRTSNNGKDLERLVEIINRASQTIPSSSVERDVKLIDKQGGISQIDVLISVNANGYTFKVAIECKDKGRPVEKDQILAFASKCDMIDGISKKVFVASGGYQKGARNAANHYGIELFDINDISVEMSRYWIVANSSKMIILRKRVIKKCFITFTGVGRPDKTFDYTDKPYVAILDSYFVPFTSIGQFVYTFFDQVKTIRGIIDRGLDKKLNEIQIKEGQKEIEAETEIIFGTTDDTYIGNMDPLVYHHIKKFEIIIKGTFEVKYPSLSLLKKYNSIEAIEPDTDILIIKIEDHHLYHVCKADSLEAKMYQLDAEGNIREMLIESES